MTFVPNLLNDPISFDPKGGHGGSLGKFGMSGLPPGGRECVTELDLRPPAFLCLPLVDLPK